MVDETTDQSNREQVVIVIRHVDSDLNVQEKFIGLCMVPSIDAATLTSVILNTLISEDEHFLEQVPWPVLRWSQQHVRGKERRGSKHHQTRTSGHTAMDMHLTLLLVIL